jgi:hypothetical protein
MLPAAVAKKTAVNCNMNLPIKVNQAFAPLSLKIKTKRTMGLARSIPACT